MKHLILALAIAASPLAAAAHEMAKGPNGGPVVDSAGGGCGVAAGEPPAHRPLERVALARAPHRQGNRHGQRQPGREPGKPGRLGLRLPRRPLDPRQPGHRVVTEAVDVVVRPRGVDARDR